MAWTDAELAAYNERRAAEAKALDEAADGLRAYARAIAAALADGWTLQPIDMDREHTMKVPHVRQASTGAEFWISSSWRNDGKLSVHGSWPKNAHGREEYPYFSQYSDNGPSSPTIGFSRSKSAVLAARDIARRFLPAYLPLYAKQCKIVEGNNDTMSQAKVLAAKIASLLLGKVNQRDAEKLPTVWLGYRPHGINEVDFDTDKDQITVKLSCTYAELEQLAELFPWLEPETDD